MEGNISLLLENEGNLLEQMLDEKKYVGIVRVYPCGSRTGDTIFSVKRESIQRDQTIKDLKVLELIDKIRAKVNEQGWNDNKIVVETFVGVWQIFIGYWDDAISLGSSVKPNLYYNPKSKTEFGHIKMIKVR